MSTHRFRPELCPGCQTRIEARYSQYRHAPQHWLSAPLLIAGVVFTIVLTAYIVWSTALSILDLFGRLGLDRIERGILFFFACAATVPFLLWVARKWARLLHGLPRKFPFECPVCRWAGNVKVKECSAPPEASGGLQVRLEMEGLPEKIPDPLDAKRERQRQQSERERKRFQKEEQELLPNPDFNF
jgi:hypothetical protein